MPYRFSTLLPQAFLAFLASPSHYDFSAGLRCISFFNQHLGALTAVPECTGATRLFARHKIFFGKYKRVCLYPSFKGVIMKDVKPTQWVLITKVIEQTGYTEDAIRAKKKRHEWHEGVHWNKAPDNRLVFDLLAINAWMGGQHA